MECSLVQTCLRLKACRPSRPAARCRDNSSRCCLIRPVKSITCPTLQTFKLRVRLDRSLHWWSISSGTSPLFPCLTLGWCLATPYWFSLARAQYCHSLQRRTNTEPGAIRDCVETRFAAVPPDVRKGCALPARVDGIRGYAPTQGRSPGMIRVLPSVGRSRHRTSGGTAVNRSFHTVSYPLPVPYLSTHSAVVLAYALRLRSPSEVALIF